MFSSVTWKPLVATSQFIVVMLRLATCSPSQAPSRPAVAWRRMRDLGGQGIDSLKGDGVGMVGAEGFEVSFPSGHYAVFFVEIKGKPNQNERLPNFSDVPFFPYSLTSGPHSARSWYHWYHPSFDSLVQSQRGPLSHVQCHGL